MKDNLRIILALPFLVPLFVGLLLVYIFGIPFLIIGGKRAAPIFDVVSDMIKS